MANMLYNNLVYGETDVSVLGRPDLEPYRFGVSHLENFNVGILGGISRREGLKKIELENINNLSVELGGKTRIIEFVRSRDDTYLLLFSHLKLKVFDISANEIVVELNSLYSESELDELQYAQDSESVVIVHKNHPPCVYCQVGNTYIFEPINFLYDARTRKEKTGEGTYDYTNLFNNGDYPSVVAFAGSRLVLANTPQHPYRLFFSRPFEKENFTTFDTIAETTEEIKELSDEEWAEITNKHTLNKLVREQLDIVLNTMLTQKYHDTTFDIDRISYQDITSDLDSMVTELGNKGYSNERITSQVTTAKSRIREDARKHTDESASFLFNVVYEEVPPRIEEIFTELEKNGTIDSFYDVKNIKFTQEDIVTSDCAVVLDIGGNKNDAINWVAVNQNIIVGTASTEWVMPLGINALEQSINQISAYGSRQVQGVCSNNKVLFVQGAGYIGSVGFDGQSYGCDNLNIYNKEILKSGVVAICWQRIETPRLFVLLENGTLAVLTYNTLNGVRGWNRWTFAGDAKCVSVAVVDSESSQDVYAVMQYKVIVENEAVIKYGLFKFDKELQSDEEIGDFESVLFSNPIESSNYSSILNFKNGKVIGIRATDTNKVMFGWSGSYIKEMDFANTDIAIVPLPSTWQKDLRLCIKASGNNKANILAIVANMEIG